MNACEYCGQVLIDGEECKCPEVAKRRTIEDQISRAVDTINRMFSDESGIAKPIDPQNAEALIALATAIAQEKMCTVTVNMPDGVRATLSRTPGGAVKISRTDARKFSTEVTQH